MNGSTPTVGDVMTRSVVALAAGAAFKDIVRTIQRFKVSALPVVDPGNRVVGVVSEADLLLKEEFRAGGPDPAPRGYRADGPGKAAAVNAGELMTAPAVTVSADATVPNAARLMARHQVKRLPVVDRAGRLTGIVSRSDLLKVFLRDDEDIAAEIGREVVGRLFPRPLAPVRVEVREGVVTLTGRVADTALIPVAARLARTVEGVVDVRIALLGPPRRPDLDPDLPDDPDGADLPHGLRGGPPH